MCSNISTLVYIKTSAFINRILEIFISTAKLKMKCNPSTYSTRAFAVLFVLLAQNLNASGNSLTNSPNSVVKATSFFSVRSSFPNCFVWIILRSSLRCASSSSLNSYKFSNPPRYFFLGRNFVSV